MFQFDKTYFTNTGYQRTMAQVKVKESMKYLLTQILHRTNSEMMQRPLCTSNCWGIGDIFKDLHISAKNLNNKKP